MRWCEKLWVGVAVSCFVIPSLTAQRLQVQEVGLGFGHRNRNKGNPPCRLSDDRFVLLSEGTSTENAACDDGFLVVSGVSGPRPTIMEIPLYGLVGAYELQAVTIDRLAEDAFLFRGCLVGEPREARLVVVQGLDDPHGWSFVVHDKLPGPVAMEGGLLRPAIFGEGQTLVLPGPGFDGSLGTADDQILVATGLRDPAAFRAWAHQGSRGLARCAVPFGDGMAALASRGSDCQPVTYDDGFFLVTTPAQVGDPHYTFVPAGHPVGEWNDARPLKVGHAAYVWPTTLGFGIGNAGLAPGLSMLRREGASAEVVPLPYLNMLHLTPWGAPHPASDGESYRMVYCARGQDGLKGTVDDELVIVTELDGDPQLTVHVPGHALSMAYWEEEPILVGDRLIMAWPGPDSIWGWGANDGVTIVEGVFSENPSVREIPLELSVVALHRSHENAVWVQAMTSLPIYLSDLDAPTPTVTALDIDWGITRPCLVNPWTHVLTNQGLAYGLCNDPLVLVRSPCALLGEPREGEPRLRVWCDPVAGLARYPVLMEGAPARAPLALAICTEPGDFGRIGVDLSSLLLLIPGQTDALGSKQWEFHFAPDPEFIGWRVVLQAGVCDPLGPYGHRLSNTLEVHL